MVVGFDGGRSHGGIFGRESLTFVMVVFLLEAYVGIKRATGNSTGIYVLSCILREVRKVLSEHIPTRSTCNDHAPPVHLCLHNLPHV